MKQYKKLLAGIIIFAFIVGLLPFSAFAADAQIYIRFERDGTRIWNSTYKAGTTLYAITAEDGAISTGDANNWNVKFEFPTKDDPTITLRGATIAASISTDFPIFITGNTDLTIMVETDSTITAQARTALYLSNTGITTITGPGKLTITTQDGACITTGSSSTFNAGELHIKDANLDLRPTATATTRYAIGFTGKDLIIDNSKVNIAPGGQCMGISGLARVETDETGKITTIASYWTSSNPAVADAFVRFASVTRSFAVAIRYGSCSVPEPANSDAA